MSDVRIVQGRRLSDEDLALIVRLIEEHPQAHRRRLSQMLCEIWEWKNQRGQYKDMAARTLMRKLDGAGLIILPPPRRPATNARRGQKVAARDQFIGWEQEGRRTGLSGLANNSRFLILPGVRVPHLASHILSLATARLRRDWMEQYGHPVELVETFVQRDRFAGTCYRAANWQWLGATQGRSRNDRNHEQAVPVKDIYVYALSRSFRQRLGGKIAAHA